MAEKMIAKLTNLVMNERQAKVYLAILTNNTSTASELNRLSGVPLNKMYETLKILNSRGFCVKRNSNNKITYVATDPTIAFQKIIEQKKKQLQDTELLMHELNEIYNSKPLQSDLSDYIEIVHGNENVHKKFIELLNNMKHRGLSISCPPYTKINAQQRAEQKKAADAFFKRGGKDKSIREINADTPAFIFDSIRSTLNDYEPADNRIINKSPIKLFIFDDEVLMTFNKSFMQAGDEICASIIKQPNTVNTYIHMFNYLFEQAETFENWIRANEELYNRKLMEYDQEKENKGGKNA